MGKTVTNDPYKELGVSSSKEGVHEAIKGLPKGLFPGAFCNVVPMPSNFPDQIRDDYVQVIHSDGVGTKSNIAYIQHKEGRDWFLSEIMQNAIVMNTDDMACIGVTDDFFITNHISRNANRVGDDVLRKILQGYTSYFQRMKELGITMYPAGGETADVGSYVSTFGIDVTATGIIRKDRIIDCSNIGPDQIIVGLASDGQCSYEEKENSGIRSNGLTLAVNVLLSPYYRKYSETMDSTLSKEKLYRGKYCLEEKLEGSSLTIGEALLSPTRTYVPVIRDILQDDIKVSGIIHCTGGGLTKSINFGHAITYVKDPILGQPTPAIFKAIQKSGRIEDKYMYQTFNMGVGMEIYVPDPEDAMKVIAHAAKYDIRSSIIGHTETSSDGKNKVRIGRMIYTK